VFPLKRARSFRLTLSSLEGYATDGTARSGTGRDKDRDILTGSPVKNPTAFLLAIQE
jgi:hypothetical protein